MTTELNLNTCTVISSLINGAIENIESKLRKMQNFSNLMDNPLLSEMFDKALKETNTDKAKVAESIKECEEKLRCFQNAQTQLKNVLPFYAKVNECGLKIAELEKKYKECDAWSTEEFENFKNLYQYSHENKDFVDFDVDGLEKDYRRYLKEYEEKNAGK